MSPSPHVCCRITRQCISSASDYIWISDDILSSAWRRFNLSRSPKRNGSSVPGPLEASRRLAKRRMMGLAVAGGGSGLDMGGELKHRSWQWEPPTITGGLGSDRSPALPSWLANFVPTDEPKPECHQQKPPGLGTALNEFNKHHSVDFEIRLRLGFCTNVESIARLLKELGIGMQDITTYSRLAFDHLLQKDANLESVIKYLEDPTINVPAAENLLRYIESLKDHHLSTSELAELCRYAEQAVVLGLISEIEIRSISRVASVINSISDLDTALPMFEGVQLIQSIWTGFQHSAVFPAKDLEGLTLNLLLCHLAKGSYTEGNRSLVASIVASATQAQLRHMTEGISIYLAAWYRNGMVREVDNPELDYQANVIPGLADFIDSLPLAIARSSLASATVALISHNEDGEVGAAQSVLLFRKWMMSLVQSAQFKASVIGSSEWQVIEQSFGRPKHSNYVSLYLDQFIEVDQCRFILRNWVPEHVQPAGGLTEDLICSAVRRQFDELCPAQEGTHCYSSLILALCRTQQPYHQIFHDLLWVLRDSARPEAVLQTIEQLQILQVPLQPSILGAEVRRYSAISVRVALRIFELHLALKLEGSMDFVLALINDPSSHVDTTFRLLKRHQKSTKNNRRNVRTFPQARSRLLHKMATAFAHASHLRPRVAFRKVYQCYLHLHKEGFVLRAEIARALTHAGIVRGLQAGQRVSTMQIKWILRKVQEVEGDQVEKDVDSTVYHWRGIVLQRLGRQRYKDMLRTALKMGSR